MDDRRFDSLTRSIAGHRSRRVLLRGLPGSGALLVAAHLRLPGAAARHGTSGPGDPCRHDDQCRAADTPSACAWNGFGGDGEFNCCTFDGGRCGDDGGCCGYGYCAGGFCAGVGSVVRAGNGGVATANANGGTVTIGNINSGGNAGNAIGVGNSRGNVSVNGGYVANGTDLSVAANGGTAIADASGGNDNVAGDDGGYYQSGQYVDPRCSRYPLGPGCNCWQDRYDDDPCAGSMICCRQGGDSSGVCMELQACTGWYGPGEACPGYCDWGNSCPSCTTGYCDWG
jgi:hypothetical protein